MICVCFSVCVCVCRLALLSVDMELKDYDSRTALHLAAAEGNTSAAVDLKTSNTLKLWLLTPTNRCSSEWSVGLTVLYWHTVVMDSPRSAVMLCAAFRTHGGGAIPAGGLQGEPGAQRQVSPDSHRPQHVSKHNSAFYILVFLLFKINISPVYNMDTFINTS